MPFEVFILGNNSAIPAHGRHPTSQVVFHNEKIFLIDCGEGTQMQLAKYKIKKSRIEHIFISHLHGDHYFGLIGLLTSYHLMRRELPVHIYGPEKLLDIIQLQLDVAGTKLCYNLIFKCVTDESETLIFENHELTIKSFPVKHRIPTTGFFFREKEKQRNIIGEKIEGLNLPVEIITNLKKGIAGEWNEKKFSVEEFTTAPLPPSTYAFCADTIFHEELKKHIDGCDMIYHESTFMDESAERAVITFHSTAKQAATMANLCGVKKLLLGHFSAKYENLEPLLAEAKTIFENSFLAIEGEKFSTAN